MIKDHLIEVNDETIINKAHYKNILINLEVIQASLIQFNFLML